MPTATQKTRTPRAANRIVLRDASAAPGVALMQRLAEYRRPLEEDLAILESWGRCVIPIRLSAT